MGYFGKVAPRRVKFTCLLASIRYNSAVIQGLLAVLRPRRLDLDLRQKQVAERIGTTQTNYSELERGKRDPRLSTLQNIARALCLEVMLVPAELVDAVNSLTGHGIAPEEKTLFFADPD